jgi:hypothetical protein
MYRFKSIAVKTSIGIANTMQWYIRINNNASYNIDLLMNSWLCTIKLVVI